MPKATVWTFFYGSNINLDVLKKVDYIPSRVEVARLHGFDIRIRPLANLVRSDRHCVYGILATGTHAELDRLYGRYVRDELGAVYLPQAVLCEKLDGTLMPALCYVAPEIEPAQATDDYLDRIIAPAREFGFPDWYIERLEEFRSQV
ncbi:MAG: gamma-glutamylcyclotransferase family protein [Kiloniellales bacterium]